MGARQLDQVNHSPGFLVHGPQAKVTLRIKWSLGPRQSGWRPFPVQTLSWFSYSSARPHQGLHLSMSWEWMHWQLWGSGSQPGQWPNGTLDPCQATEMTGASETHPAGFMKCKSGDHTPVFISGLEWVSSFKFQGINISDDFFLGPAHRRNYEEGVATSQPSLIRHVTENANKPLQRHGIKWPDWLHQGLIQQFQSKGLHSLVDSAQSIKDTVLPCPSTRRPLSSRIQAIPSSHCYHSTGGTEAWTHTSSGSGTATFLQPSSSWTDLRNPNPTSTMKHYGSPPARLWACFSNYVYTLMLCFCTISFLLLSWRICV